MRTKQTHTYTYYRFIQSHFHSHTPSRQPHHRFQFKNSKYISPTLFPLNFFTNLDARYQEQSSTSTPLRLDWNTFVAPPPLFGQHQESSRLHNWALSRLQNRQDIHKDIQEHNIQILQQNSLQLKYETTVRLNNIVQHPFPLSPPNITAQSLPPPFITTEVIYNYDRYTKNTIG